MQAWPHQYRVKPRTVELLSGRAASICIHYMHTVYCVQYSHHL